MSPAACQRGTPLPPLQVPSVRSLSILAQIKTKAPLTCITKTPLFKDNAICVLQILVIYKKFDLFEQSFKCFLHLSTFAILKRLAFLQLTMIGIPLAFFVLVSALQKLKGNLSKHLENFNRGLVFRELWISLI